VPTTPPTGQPQIGAPPLIQTPCTSPPLLNAESVHIVPAGFAITTTIASSCGAADVVSNTAMQVNVVDGAHDVAAGTCRRCFASLFTDRAIHYRVDQGFDQFKVSLSIGVMKMVRSDISSSGVMFSIDTESGFRDAVLVTGAYGLGENVVQGAVDPDEFYVHKPTYLAGHRAVLRRLTGDKAVKMILVEGETKNTTRNIPTPKSDRARFCLTDEDVLELAGST
jgi:phosphoenolpyruvate synthase/pyruvate phosphate dikinase